MMRHARPARQGSGTSARSELQHGRAARRTPGGVADDVWADLLTWDELAGLRCRERWGELRPASAVLDDRWPVLRLVDVLTLARQQSRQRARAVGVAIEVKAGPPGSRSEPPALVEALLGDLAATGTPCTNVPVWLMAFDPAVLEEVRLQALGALDVVVREALDLGVEGLVGDQPALLRRLACVR